MNSFHRTNLNHIRDIFERKTGVRPAAGRPRPVFTAALLVAVLACGFTATAFAVSLFSSLAGDDLSLNAVYEGNGVVTVQVENRSDKELRFQPQLKLMQWETGLEVEPRSDAVVFSGTVIPARSSGVMTIQLAEAYDMEQLEAPLGSDWYYLVLTNHNFMFGQDWMCSVDFCGADDGETASPEPLPPAEIDGAVLQSIEEQLRFYFETVSFDAKERRAMASEYVRAYTELLDGFEGNLISPVSPVLPGNRISPDLPRFTVSDPPAGVIFDEALPPEEQALLAGQNYRSVDANFKLLAAEGEYALTLSVLLPLERYQDASGELPLFYILTYDKADLTGGADYAFLYGQLVPFSDLAPCQVYEDEQYVCYEVSGLIYSDLEEYVQSFAGQNPDIRLDGQVWTRVQRVYDYYKENLSGLLCRR